MKLFSYLSVAVLLLSSIALAAYSPDLLSALIVGCTEHRRMVREDHARIYAVIIPAF